MLKFCFNKPFLLLFPSSPPIQPGGTTPHSVQSVKKQNKTSVCESTSVVLLCIHTVRNMLDKLWDDCFIHLKKREKTLDKILAGIFVSDRNFSNFYFFKLFFMVLR